MTDPFEQLVAAMSHGPQREVPTSPGHRRVYFNGPWERFADGWCILVRAYARAMGAAGADVRLLSWLRAPVDEEARAEVSRFLQRPASWDIHLYSAPLNGFEHSRGILKQLRVNVGPQGLHAMFEREQIEPELAKLLNEAADGIFATCSANAEVLKRCGVERVVHIPNPFFWDDPHLDLDFPRGHRRFYWIGRWEPRKAPHNLIRAFAMAFRPGEATLTLKLSPYGFKGDYETPEEVLETIDWRTRKDIRVISARLSAREMLGLHARNDVYVSASRGEGLELGAFAAKLAGRRLVVTDSGGPRDYVDEGDVLVSARSSVAADPAYPWGCGATYIDYSIEELAAGMQKAASGTGARTRVSKRFEAAEVGRALNEWIETTINTRNRTGWGG